MLCKYFTICFLLISPVLSRLPEDDSSCYHRCFHQPAEACPKSTCRCRQLSNCKKAAVCCDVNRFTLQEGIACANITSSAGDEVVEALHIRNATLDFFNITLSAWRRLKYMSITDGQINSIVGEFAKYSTVSCLNFSSNGIRKFEQRSLVNLYNLSYLDLSHNNLTDVPRFKKEGAVTLDITENPSMSCSSVKDIISRPEISFNNENSTICSLSKNFGEWFKSTDSVAISQIKLIHQLEKNCFGKCTCIPHRLEFVRGKSPTFTVEVNCSAINSENKLTSLPTPLPIYTVVLDISNNNITSLKELSDPSYQYLTDLYADNNRISSIQPLEGTKFMNNFAVLSLRNNKIKTFETYLIRNIKFYRTTNSRIIKLGRNKLHCDCQTAMEFKVWLLNKVDYIPDYKEITCDNMDVKVIDLDQSKLCQGEQDWTDYIYYIITAEVLLLVGLIAKVSYDYWVFKTAGYLPWPASKMPKLPCDWLCE